MEFTQEQQNHIDNLIKIEKEKWIKDELNPLKTQIKDLEQYKPKTKTEKEMKIEQKEQELWTKEKSLILKEHGLDKFADFINANNAEDLQKNIDAFKDVMKEMKIDNSFVPQEHSKNNKTEYDKAAKSGDTLGMISHKLSKMFSN